MGDERAKKLTATKICTPPFVLVALIHFGTRRTPHASIHIVLNLNLKNQSTNVTQNKRQFNVNCSEPVLLGQALGVATV